MRVLLWAAALLGLLFAAVALLAKATSGFTVPGWVLAAAAVCTATAVVLMLIGAPARQ